MNEELYLMGADNFEDFIERVSDLEEIKKDKEIERLHSIIKEVREYINEDKNCVPKHIKEYFKDLLDKVEENK